MHLHRISIPSTHGLHPAAACMSSSQSEHSQFTGIFWRRNYHQAISPGGSGPDGGDRVGGLNPVTGSTAARSGGPPGASKAPRHLTRQIRREMSTNREFHACGTARAADYNRSVMIRYDRRAARTYQTHPAITACYTCYSALR